MSANAEAAADVVVGAEVKAGGVSTHRGARWAWLALIVVTTAVYWPVRQHAFLSYDDADYVTHNSHVRAGLTSAGIGWAFTSVHASNWHPLTWISHMADQTIFGDSPAGPHLVNVFLHALNAGLVLAVLNRFTGKFWRALLVALLFALHPLRVESVAWVAERKDVLSAFFFLLSVRAYAAYAAPAPDALWGKRAAYLVTLVLFTCALLSKPMAVTLPCVLLLLDFWPLQRIRYSGRGVGLARFGRLVREKIPFVLLSAASGVVTVIAQTRGGTVRSLDSFSWSERAANAVVAVAEYLQKTVWPSNLCAFYPHPGAWPVIAVAGSGILVAGVSLLALSRVRRWPFVAVGWCWFIGMLMPTLGLVQVGNQAMADRYTYLPSIGLLIAIVWLVSETLRTRVWGGGLCVLPCLAVIACLCATSRQLMHWENSERLFTRALAVTERNYVAHNGLGYHFLEQGRWEDARLQFARALEIQPRFAEAHANLGSAWFRSGHLAEARESFEKAREIQPALAAARYNLGTLALQEGRPDEAIRELLYAAKLRPDDATTRINLGNAWLQTGRADQAAGCYREALRIDPANADAHNNLGYVLLQAGDSPAAIPHFEEAVKHQRSHVNAHYNLGDALARLGRFGEAAVALEKTLTLQPNDADARALLEAIHREEERVRSVSAR